MKKLTIAVVFALTALSASAHELSWKPASGGEVPDGALAFGHERTGEALFVCRAEHAGGVHIGKVRAPFGGCNVPYGGKEIKKRDYEVLVSLG